MFLDPAKLLVILIVALVVLGPDKLPSVARQMGAAWGEIRRFRERLETEVRGTFPDLPSTHQVAEAVRSPLAFLDQLADAHEREQKQAGLAGAGGSTDVDRSDRDRAEPDRAEPDRADQPLSIRPSAPAAADQNGADRQGRSKPAGPGDAAGFPTGNSRSAPRQVGRTRPWRGSQPAEPAFIPDDPSMN